MHGLGVVGLVLVATLAVEIAVLIGVAHLLGSFGLALLLLLATSVLGSLLLRREGIRAWRRFRAAAQQGRSPGEEVSGGLVGLAGAVLLVIPGFVTDVVGLALLVPPVRRLARSRMQAFAERRVSPALASDLFGPRRVRVRSPHGDAAATGDTIEGEIVEPHEKPPAA